ncbi:hypothetical protein IT779_19265 [Nocardia sp. NEAU-351]|uniref:Integral membrane protein n=1 Tax=Nocardia bovistercoris TaxID=2785916 RepID=A0A931IC81_9NOCA|nr:hypothetical protein [Nocardia bovistercoris]
MPRERTARRAELVAVGAAIVLVAAAFIVPRIAGEQWRLSLYAAAAPIFGSWLPHIGWGTVPAIVLAAAVVVAGPAAAARLSWPRLLVTGYVAAVGWALSLALVDGWRRGFAERFTDPNEYLHEVPGVTDIPAMLRGFADRILDFQPDSWTTHVSGHPPGALLFFVLLDRVGLGGPTPAALACLLIGCSAIPAVAVAFDALGVREHARAALPYLVLAPAALWIAVSADAMFMAVAAWAVAILAVAARRASAPLAVAAGVLFGLTVFLNYGLVLMALPAVAVLIAGKTMRPLGYALAGAAAVVAAFALAGFWWLDGYHLVVERYYQGIATTRPFAYWWWGNLAATVCAIGLASVAALTRVPARLRAGDPAAILITAALCAVLLADASGLSKAETERIWLPFDIWLLAAPAFLPRPAARIWLTVQAAGTLLLVHLLLTNW